MDGEISYESDISESWSLIDVNLNEESVPGAEAQVLVENSPLKENNLNIKNEEKEMGGKRDDIACKKLENLASGRLFQNEEACDSEEIEEIFRKSSDEENKTDCGDSDSIEILDSDSIEILDVKGNYRETDIDKLNISFIGDQDDKIFPSDEDELLYKEKSDTEDKNIISAVIKRKKRKLSSHSESSSIDSINSDFSSSNGKYYSEIRASKLFGDDFSLETLESSTRPVYKHYRNNVANTVLSLSMGVIFAGVACIAIGHFLGVHDAGETAAELMQSLKKLQMENIALQSRLSHLNRAFHTRDLNSKSNPLSNEFLENNFCIRRQQRKATKIEIEPPPILQFYNSRFSREKFTELQNIVKTKTSPINNEKGVDLPKLVNNIHDQITYLNSYGTKDVKLRELGAKISKVVQKIIDRMIHSQDNFEMLEQLNEIVSNVVSENRYCDAKEKITPVTETHLSSVEWKSKKISEESEKSIPVIYPQLEEYYEGNENSVLRIKNETESINEKVLKVIETSENPVERSMDSVVELEEKLPKLEESKERKKDNKRNDKMKKEKRKSEKKSKKIMKIREGSNTCSKKKDKVWEKKQKFLLKKTRQTFNETKKFHGKIGKVVKKALNDIKQKRSLIRKRSKKSKLRKVLVSSFLQREKPKDKIVQKCHLVGPGFRYQKHEERCLNLTDNWLFGRAKSRQEFRRDQILGDWQFKRAKSRRELRGGDLILNWQFKRAKSRRELRGGDLILNWQFKRAIARENNRNDETYRIRSFNRKGFFHEFYSWF